MTSLNIWTMSVIAVSLLVPCIGLGFGLDPHLASASISALFAAFVFATGASAIQAPAGQPQTAR